MDTETYTSEEFQTEGRRTIEKNWHRFYGSYARFKEKPLPELEEGDYLKLEEIKL